MTPREMFSEDGATVVWRAELSLWGELSDLRRRAATDDAAPDCPIRFQGQFKDPESGLHYNRFCYYDPSATQYLSPDPIGLEGGLRPQGYVADPNGWVDPLGLAGCPDANSKMADFRNDLGFPVAGGRGDKSTIALMNLDGREIYGINTLGQPVSGVNAIPATHAEIDVLNQIRTQRIDVSGRDLILHVDRDPCAACGQNGGIRSMAEQSNLGSITVIGPSGPTVIYPRNR